MKAASELIREYESLELSITEKEDWLERTCREYAFHMPNDRIGQSRLFCFLGEEYLKDNRKDLAKDAYLKAKEILEFKAPVRKKVGCGYQEIEKDLTDSPEYGIVMEQLKK